MRSRVSLLNSLCALVSYGVLFLGPFLVSPCLKFVLGSEILGIQKTFQDTVALINVVELGISYGVIYKLYGPIAEKNTKKISVLLKFYKSTFKIIALCVTFLGILVSFLVPKIVSGKYHSRVLNDSWLSSVFLIYVLESMLSYLFGHKRILLIADQKNYIATLCRTVCQILMFVVQIVLLFIFKSFLIYSLARPLFALLESILINIEFKKKYKNISTKVKEKLEKREKWDLIRTLSALFYHRMGAQSIITGSTLILVHKLGEKITGFYYPYVFITNGIISATNQVFNAILPSFGNYLAKHTKNESYILYKKIYFFNYLLFSYCSIVFFCIVSPFISIWMGADCIFNMSTIVLITLNFYLSGIRHSIFMAKASIGLYREDRFFAILEAVINIVLSYTLSSKFGINGVLLGSIISTVAVPFWVHPYLVYQNLFRTSVKTYHKRFLVYLLLTIIMGTVSYYCCSLTRLYGNFLQIVANILICTTVFVITNLLVFNKKDEFRYLMSIAKMTFEKVFKKFPSKSTQ